MLISRDGCRIGTISGGCLENDVCKKAWWLTERGIPAIRTYDARSDDDSVPAYGMGCNGAVDILLERTDSTSVRNQFEFLKRAREQGRDCVIATVVGGEDIGSRLCIQSDGLAAGDLCGTEAASALLEKAAEVFATRRSTTIEWRNNVFLLEWIGMPPHLVVFGGGGDAVPLANIATSIGWRVTVADNRPGNLATDRFPASARTVLLRSGDHAEQANLTSRCVVVLMTHNYTLDREVLRDALPLRPAYVGILGPRHRTDRLLRELGEQDAEVHAPIGLDIGADTPQTIALAIVAEVQATLAGRSGQKLRNRNQPIHDPVPEAVIA